MEANDYDGRVILFLDVDAFTIQVLVKEYPEFSNRPFVTMHGKFGEEIATISYEGRSYGITRKMTLDEAKAICPELQVFTFDFDSEDMDPLESSRRAAWNISNVVHEFVINELGLSQNEIEIASQDEIYLDVTSVIRRELNLATFEFDPKELPKIYVEGKDDCSVLTDISIASQDKIFIHAGLIAQKLCKVLYTDVRTGFKCSAGIAHNKLLAKVGCGLHRPNSVTVLLPDGIDRISSLVKVGNIPGLGHKQGDLLKERFEVRTMSELRVIPNEAVRKTFGNNTAKLVKQVANWIDDSPVVPTKLSPDLVCRRRIERKGDYPPESHEDILKIIRLVSKRMELRLAEERQRYQRTPSKLKLGMKPGGATEVEFLPLNLSWEDFLRAALVRLAYLYDESKGLRIKEISLTAYNFSHI